MEHMYRGKVTRISANDRYSEFMLLADGVYHSPIDQLRDWMADLDGQQVRVVIEVEPVALRERLAKILEDHRSEWAFQHDFENLKKLLLAELDKP